MKNILDKLKNWHTWEKILKVIAVLVIVGIGIVEFIEYKYCLQQLQWNSQEFSNWTLPIFTLGGTIALIITLWQYKIMVRDNRSKEYFEKYKNEIKEKFSGEKNPIIPSRYTEIPDNIIESMISLKRQYKHDKILEYFQNGQFKEAKALIEENKPHINEEFSKLTDYKRKATFFHNDVLALTKEIKNHNMLSNHHKNLLRIIIKQKIYHYLNRCNAIVFHSFLSISNIQTNFNFYETGSYEDNYFFDDIFLRLYNEFKNN